MPTKAPRASNLELLRILCMLLIIGDHLTGQGGIADYSTLPSSFVFCLIGCGSRIACTVFVLVGSWFMCEQPFKTRRPLSLWLSLWLYTVPVTLLCRLAGLDVSLGALRWAAFPAGYAPAVVHLGLSGAAALRAAAQPTAARAAPPAPTKACCWCWLCRWSFTPRCLARMEFWAIRRGCSSTITCWLPTCAAGRITACLAC